MQVQSTRHGTQLHALLGAALLVYGSAVHGDSLNGFDLSSLSVPRTEIAEGGPVRDGIPALTDPKFVPGRSAAWLAYDDRVLGISRNGVAKAYPLQIMGWHEVVNDRFGSEPVLVTYCPLCFTGMAFEGRIGKARRIFGVSGVLYNSDVLLYDLATLSLWSQVLGVAVSGPSLGAKLEGVPVENTSWGAWRRAHPESRVLSRETGYRRDYDHDPYAWYDRSPDLAFPVAARSLQYHPKEYVLGVELHGEARVYPFSELDKLAEHSPNRRDVALRDTVGGQIVFVHYDAVALSARLVDALGRPMASTMAYWFAWYAFHPGSRVYQFAEGKH